MTKKDAAKHHARSAPATWAFDILSQSLKTAQSLPTWLRFIVVFAVLFVVVVLRGKVQTSLVPILYLLLLLGSGIYLWLERSRGKQISEKHWLEQITTRLRACGTARVYLRYFRDPDHLEDIRIKGKEDKIREIMTSFAELLLDHPQDFFLIGFRKNHWTDDPKQWLVRKMREMRPDVSEANANDTVERQVLVIHDEPLTNSSTIYLIDNFLFFNRVTGEVGDERKTYHAQELTNSIMPYLIKNGFRSFLKS